MWEQISKKYLPKKTKEIVEWNSKNGTVKITILNEDGSVKKETLKEVKKA